MRVVHYLHSQDIFHRYVVWENLWVDSNDNLLLDSLGMTEKEETSDMGYWGDFSSPESDAHWAKEIPSYGRKHDVWQLGCLLMWLCDD